MSAAPIDPKHIMDPADGVTRLWTNEERIARWPKLDYSVPRTIIPELDGIYAPHNALRSDLVKLNSALAVLDGTEEPIVYANVAWWFASFHQLLHDHHDIEETVFIPFTTSMGADVSKVKMAKDHATLVAVLDGLLASFRELAVIDKASRPGALAAVKITVTDFTQDMREHLREEEDTLIPGE